MMELALMVGKISCGVVMVNAYQNLVLVKNDATIVYTHFAKKVAMIITKFGCAMANVC